MINFGILGTSDLSKRSLIGASEELPDVNVLAVASRCLERAEEYATKNGISRFFGAYDELIDHPDIQAVYIPLVPSIHAEWVIKAIKAGKHVLVEKPLCLTSSEIAQIKATLANHPVLLMEAMMSQYHTWQSDLKEILQNQSYGQLLSLSTTAQYILPEDDLTFRRDQELGGGVFREEGNAWLQLVQLCFGLDYDQKRLKADFKQGVDMSFECQLDFDEGRFARVTCAYDRPYKAVHELQFEETTISVQNFWRPTFGANKLKLNYTSGGHSRKHIYAAENYYVNQLKHFVQLLNNKSGGSEELVQAFQRVKITEELYESIQPTPVS